MCASNGFTYASACLLKCDGIKYSVAGHCKCTCDPLRHSSALILSYLTSTLHVLARVQACLCGWTHLQQWV